ncbi:MAG: type II toxin-antitoxin system VapC family toxin [Bifidobacteriaceae bacterium]|nr:type II toxin-antitoxin system VapC family toxin [Bifidobacteriaceae bacterium]
MIIDTSAIACVLKSEPDRNRVMDRLVAGDPLRMSTGTASELHVVVTRWVKPVAHAKIDYFLASLGVELVAYDARQLETFRRAYRLYGRGGHNDSLARLNFGDCFAYALAKVTGEPLLFIGDDFTHTDLVPALR